MATAEEIRARIEKMREQLMAVESKERGAALKTARDLVAKFGFEAAELGLRPAGKKVAAKKGKVERPAKYKHPKTGATWNGWGKPPAWMPKDKTKRDKYLIGGEAAPSQAGVAAEAAAKGAPRSTAKKAAAKAPAKKPAAKTVAAKKVPAKKAAAKKLDAKKGAATSGDAGEGGAAGGA